MTYGMCWYKAFSLSCVAHLLCGILLVAVLGNIESQPLPERQMVIELTAVEGSSSQSSEPAPAVSPASPAASPEETQAKPVVSRPAVSPVDRQVAVPRAGHVLAGSESAVVTAAVAGGAGGSGKSTAAEPAAGSGSERTAARAPGGGELDSIINAFLQQIEKRKDYPYMARRRGQVGTVTVAVRLNEVGELASVQVLRSSGVAALDEAALALVRKVCPFTHNTGQMIAMNIPIDYQIE
ncbi:TonB family protein [Sporomusa sphaeroides]|uniref:Gram-negative bacterial tonB protein n=1 Tax=Sporomusa sphaeroides DSM 2875 TaxID=1337886 RepID=A0ABM9W262_9FIRM|nr:TonB family protein [Sporomusa sphaeroides]OLS56084.1 gram-negative bacterial tonB protein [Sporomusa sphaeroides DSM 2875]CVK19274.1 Gram-negative bacterial tonB protein [Sporomusa sphaeroides DSM 2875]